MKYALLRMALAVALAATASPMMAHHAGTAYDSEHPITLTGIVTGYQLVSPHTQILFDVKDDKGNVTSWVALAGPPQRMYRNGWRADSLKAGDKVTVTGAPSKDGHKYMGAEKVVGPDGKTLGAGGA